MPAPAKSVPTAMPRAASATGRMKVAVVARRKAVAADALRAPVAVALRKVGGIARNPILAPGNARNVKAIASPAMTAMIAPPTPIPAATAPAAAPAVRVVAAAGVVAAAIRAAMAAGADRAPTSSVKR